MAEMTEKILERLLTRGVISGSMLSEELGVTRAAIWKQIEQLREIGFEIESCGRQGYRLCSCPDSLMTPMIRLRLKTKWAGKQVHYFEELDSTNRRARMLALEGAPEGTLVIANAQTLGRGRRGRSWESPRGDSVLMSIILRPKVHPSKVARISLLTALAVSQAICDVTGLDARIKWPNDIVINGRKVCGMLLEMTADEQCVHDVVAGVGINVHQKEFSGEIANTATSLERECGRFIRRSDVVCAFLLRFEEYRKWSEDDPVTLLQRYRERSATLGEAVRVIALDEEFIGVAEDLTPFGSLLVRDESGVLREVLAADVSVRGVMGYV